jgi:hypothetical protein
MNAKVENYTAEQTSEIVTGYQAGEAVEVLAAKIGKSVRSVVAKLSREGVYKAKAKAKAEGKVTKADLVAMIAVKFDTDVAKLESLEKATKEALAVLVG